MPAYIRFLTRALRVFGMTKWGWGRDVSAAVSLRSILALHDRDWRAVGSEEILSIGRSYAIGVKLRKGLGK